MTSVLVYHSISSPVVPLPSGNDVSPARFAQQLSWLSRHRTILPLTETLSRPESRSEAAITFDDGFRDNLTVALPLLEKFQMPMTLFVTPGFLDREGYLSPADLREISQHPLITIGAHGLWHRHFNRLLIEEARFELVESRRVLQEITARKIDLLAWPFGECNPELEQLSADCGYKAAWSVWKGSNTSHSRYRVPVGHWDSFPRFLAKATGLYALTKARWHRVRSARQQVHGRASGGAVSTFENA
jgi:peptidoglycan/xylan/chitin deacetylase (PgdA/CDA1 family)